MAIGRKVLKRRAQAAKFTFKYEATAQAEKATTGKFYPAEDCDAKKGPAPVRNAPRLRNTITPGTVLILLAGRFRGKRVVFLKQLSSGLLLVSGPYGMNGVPLRRVNQKYVIATSTKTSTAGVDVKAIDDAFFAREKVVKSKEVFAAEATKSTVSAERKAAQTAVDAALTKNIEKTPMLSAYLKAKFTLSRADRPHAMKF